LPRADRELARALRGRARGGARVRAVPRARLPARPPPLHGGARAGARRGGGGAAPRGAMSLGARLAGSERVLVRLPSWLGDFVMAEPALRALAAARRVPFSAQDPERARDWRGHDVALLCTGSFRSVWLALCARIPRRAGFARGGRGGWLTDALEPPLERGATPLGLGRPGRGRRRLPRPFERSL